MTTATLPKRFTVQVGDTLVELPEADSRNEALRRAGLTPVHWLEHPARQRKAGKTATKPSKPSTCATCGKKLPITSQLIRFCSNKCRQQAFRNANRNAKKEKE